MAQAPATQAIQSLVGQSIAELHLGRLPEAEAAMQQATGLDASNADVLANSIVLNTILGQDTDELKKKLREVRSDHQILVDLDTKKLAFDEGLKKYNPKLEP